MLIEIEKVEKLKCSSMHYFGTFYCKVLSSKIVLLKKKDLVPFFKINVKNVLEIQYVKEKEYLIMIDTSGRFYKFDLKVNELRRFKKVQEFAFLGTFVVRDDMIIAICNDTIRKYNIETLEAETVTLIELDRMIISKIFYNEEHRIYAIISSFFIVILDDDFQILVHHKIKRAGLGDVGVYSRVHNDLYFIGMKKDDDGAEQWLVKYDIDNNSFYNLFRLDSPENKEIINALRIINNEQWLAVISKNYIKIYDVNTLEIILLYELQDVSIAIVYLEYDENLNALLFGTAYDCRIIYLKSNKILACD